MRRQEALALMAAAATGVQVGAAMVATRFVVQDIGPASLAFLRYAIAVLCLVPPLLMSVRVRFAVRDLLVVMGLGIVQFGILIALLNLGLQFISSTRAALLFSTFPLMTIIIAAILGREDFSRAKVAGVILTIIGVGVALGERLTVQNANGEWLGAVLVLAAALCGAICSVLYRLTSPGIQPCPSAPGPCWHRSCSWPHPPAQRGFSPKNRALICRVGPPFCLSACRAGSAMFSGSGR
nr:DMT family transporter [Microvirga calopogonii]